MKLDPEEIQKKILNLSPIEQKEVIDFIFFLESKKENKPKKGFSFKWEGALIDLREQYTSVELQHKISEWRI